MFHIVKGIISLDAACAVLTYHQLDGLKTVHRTVFLTPFRIPLCSNTKITTACWLWSFSVELITMFHIVKGIISLDAVCAVLTYHQLDGLKTVHRTVFLTPFRIPLCSNTKITTACWLWSFSVELITGFEPVTSSLPRTHSAY